MVSTQAVDHISKDALNNEGLNNLALPSEFVIWDELPKLGAGKIAYTKIKTMLKF